MTVNDDDALAAEFEQHRTRLRGVAYRMLGSVHEADDAVQETWLRLHRTDGIDNLGGWLTTVVGRVCLDMLRSRSSRREDDLAEQDVPVTESEAGHPAFEAELADSVGAALLVVLQSLDAGRAARLRAARPLRRALRRHRRDHRPLPRRHAPARQSRPSPRAAAARTAESGDRAVVDAFLEASRQGDFEGLLALLDPGAAVRADGAAVQMGSEALVTGARSVAETFAGRARAARPALIDGGAGAAWCTTARPRWRSASPSSTG